VLKRKRVLKRKAQAGLEHPTQAGIIRATASKGEACVAGPT
jgi:hypothetical protein